MRALYGERLMELVKDELISFQQHKEVPFSWQIADDLFHIDTKGAVDVGRNINTVDDFLHLFSQSDQAIVSGHFHRVIEGMKADPIKICIATHHGCVVLCLLSAKKITSNHLAGAMLPLFIVPTREEVSSLVSQIFENQSHGMIVTDEKTRIVACNSYFEKSTGYNVDELLGAKTSIFNAGKHGEVFFKEMWGTLNQSGYWNGLILTKGKTGTIKPQELRIQRLVSTKGRVHYLGLTQDLSDKLYRVAGIEYGGIELLTQLPGEDEFFLNVQDIAIGLEERQGMIVISFVPEFDKDIEFESKKQLASALAYHENGYSAGFIKKTVFSVAMVYERRKDKPHSLSIFETIKDRFKVLKQRVDYSVYSTIVDSIIGVSVLGLDANNENKLISHSLQAMYERHTSGNSKICFFNRALHEKIKRRETLEEIVQDSISNKKIEVFFQPIVNTSSWKVTKLEALCRFRDYNGNLLETQEMIRVAEDMKLVSSLDLVIAEKAINYRSELVKIFGSEVELTINVSLNANKSIKILFGDLLRLFKRHTQHLPYITVELTESAYFDSEQKDSNLLFDLRKKGLKVAIDDFGTGYSSFSYLKDGNFDLLKVDKEFVTDITVGSHNYYIIKMITHLAHTLDVEVVAEGVETLQEAKILHDLKVDYMQGFYFERPQPVKKLSNHLFNIESLKEAEVLDTQVVDLFSDPPILTPHHTLREIKELFEESPCSVFPIVVEDKCVGVITKEQFNLHVTPTMGTDRETTHEYHSQSKVASAMMAQIVTTVHKTINDGEIHEKVRNKNPFPWVVINDVGEYVAIIEMYNVVHYLNGS